MGQGVAVIKAFVIDTDVLVDYLRGHDQAISFVNRYALQIIIPSIVVAELYAGVKDEKEEALLETFLSLFRVVAVTDDIAKLGGTYKREYAKSHGVGLADAIIAATAHAENAELKTLNTRHYPMIKGLKPAYEK